MNQDAAVGRRLEYQPALDGLRAVAVAAVVVYHGYANTLERKPGSGGFLGVDVFFVLSGYLITSLLVAEYRRTDRVALRSFWFRRLRRLLPALLVALALAAIYAALEPLQRSDLRSDSLFTLLYVQNWHTIWSHSTTRFTPLSQTWSLSIEEQWYFVWPVALWAALRWTKGRLRNITVAVLVLAAVSAITMRLLYSSIDPGRSYYGTDARAHELLIGAALGLVLSNVGSFKRPIVRYGFEILGWCAAIFVLYEIVQGQVTDGFFFRGGIALVCVATALVITAVTRSDGLLRRGLSLRPLVWLGLISYGVYLYQRPLFALLTPSRVGTHGNALFWVRCALTIGFAWVSFRFLEKPIRDGKITVKRPQIVVPAIVAAFVGLMLVTTLAPQRAPSATLLTAQSARFYETQSQTASPKAHRVLVAGESQAFVLQNRLGNSYDGSGIHGVAFGLYGCAVGAGDIVTTAGRLPRRSECDEWPSTFRQLSDVYKPDVAVLMIGDQEIFDRYADGTRLRVGTPAWKAMMTTQLDTARAALTANGAHLLLLTSSCGIVPRADGIFAASERDPARIAAVNAALESYASKHRDSVQLGDLASALCPNGHAMTTQNGRVVIDRQNGLTSEGAKFVWEWIAAQVRADPREFANTG